MKNYLILLLTLLTASLTAHAADVKTNGNVVTIRPDGGQAKVIQLEVVNDNIIRVRATSKDELPQKPPSLMIVPQAAPAKGSYTVEESADAVCVIAKNARAVVDKRTGELCF
jgi:alpha-D-xyloside xylohydrolase